MIIVKPRLTGQYIMQLRPIYMDYNATTPCDPRVVEAMIPFFTTGFGNPSSRDHWYGWQAAEAIDEARERVASLVGASPKSIIFTSGATESINLALQGTANALKDRGRHIITCKTEHSAVLDTCAALETGGYQVSYLEVDEEGRLSLEQLEASITAETICIAVMYANNETGVINPVRAIGTLAHKYNIHFICDATQAVGKIEVDVNTDQIDLLAFSSHKIYGPKGVGALFVRNRDEQHILPQQYGGGHERGLRSGTLNTPGIVGFGKAAALCHSEMKEEAKRLEALRDRMELLLQQSIPGVVINGTRQRLPHVSNILVPYDDTEQLLLSLSSYLAVSRGSACSGLVQRPSHVLKAMGLNDEKIRRALRISLGRFTIAQEIEEAVERLASVINIKTGSSPVI
jgi:cysteine desulfurase